VDHHADATELSWDEYVDAVGSPMLVFDRHLDVVAANALAGAVSAAFRTGTNLARFAFLNPMVEETTEQWRVEARRVAAVLRESLDRHAEDQRFRSLVGELMAQSEPFAEIWAGPRTAPERHGTSVFRNPLVGVMLLAQEHLLRPESDEHTIVMWVPVGSDSSERLQRLQALLSTHPE
jgi:hypothetical protein